MATILDGKQLSQNIRDSLKTAVAGVSPKPGLAVVLVGNDAGSTVYVNNKEKACKEIGYVSKKIVLPETIDEQTLLDTVRSLNTDNEIHGILVQFPLPERIHHLEETIIDLINPDKDVDGFHPTTVGKFVTCKGTVCEEQFLPCTPAGIMELLHAYNILIAGSHAVVIGRSNLVGKPLSMLLLGEHATVTVCHSKTKNIKDITKQADILIAAIGKANFVDASFVKEGAVVIDAGINRDNGKITGDVDFASVSPVASAITPVPGGVGPMTIAMLMKNVWKAYLRQTRRDKTK